MNRDFLKDIIACKEKEVAAKQVSRAALSKQTRTSGITRYQLFKKALQSSGQVSLIAEIKKASPSKGLIRQDFDLAALARAYSDNGASAISVLTEEKYFLGKQDYLRQVSVVTRIPILAKDFFIDEIQIFEAYHCGASAILLIVAILDDAQLKSLLAAAARLDLDVLVEVHDEAELTRALNAGAEIIGINNRDLHSFKVDLGVSERLLPLVPRDRVRVIESGISSRQDVQRFQDLGADAVLVGETLMREPDVGAKIRDLLGSD